MLKKTFLWYMGYRYYWVPDTLHPLESNKEINRVVMYQEKIYTINRVWVSLHQYGGTTSDNKTNLNIYMDQVTPMKRVYMSKYTYERIMNHG